MNQSTNLPQLQSPDLPDILIQDHLERMEPAYFERYTPEVVRGHLLMLQKLGKDNLAEVTAEPLGVDEWSITVVAFDYMAEISTISGLFASNGISVMGGDVYTYATRPNPPSPRSGPPRSRSRHRRRPSRPQFSGDMTSPGMLNLRKIVDIFHVRSVPQSVPDWKAFEGELEEALNLIKNHGGSEARTRINLQVVDYLRRSTGTTPTLLYPVRITVDNDTSPDTTQLLILGQDTPAFLYALSTALSLRNVSIIGLKIDTLEDEVRDLVTVTDRNGHKITDPHRLHELQFVVALIKQFTHLLIQAPNPAKALDHFNQMIDQVLTNVKSGREMEEIFLQFEKQKVIGAMARLFGTTDFLWEDFLRMQYDNLFPILQDLDTVGIRKSREQMDSELDTRLGRVSSVDGKKVVLNRYKDREMFRIDMRQILSNERSFREFSEELSDLAEVVINAAFHISDDNLRQRHGRPMLASREPCGFCICALGKCGGRELGWASDIELLFVYTEQGMTDGENNIHNSEYFERLVRMIGDTIVARQKGIFEIDLRLRPYGDKGALACSYNHFYEYFNERGGALPYERQALIKLRVIGGDKVLEGRINSARDAFVFSPVQPDIRELSRLRERQHNELVKPGAVNVKYSFGGVIDIEYYVQSLQILHGAEDLTLRSANTLEALIALCEAGHVCQDDYRMLSEAYMFLRRLINALRIVRGNAKDLVLPDRNSQEYRFLSRRLGYTGTDVSEQLHRDVSRHMESATQAHRTRFIHKLFE